jgi:hypothetical protein
MKIDEQFELIYFHDASIDGASRVGGDLVLNISGAFLSSNHPQSNGKDWSIEKAELHFEHVSEEVAKFWDDTKAPKPHPEPELPLDEIMEAKYEDGYYVFSGFKNTVPWSEWHIKSTHFILNISAANEYSS